MTGPAAQGVRIEWAQVPAAVRAAIEDVCGAAVVQARTQPGGFSPGLAARVRCANGARYFVKAVSAQANPDTPGLHRQEARVLAALEPLINAEVGLSDRVVRDPGDTLRISKKTDGIVALMAGLAFGLIFALVLEPPFGLAVALGGALLGGVLFGLGSGLYGGFGAVMWQWILVRRSARQKLLPGDLPEFLESSAEHGYLQREGGAYT